MRFLILCFLIAISFPAVALSPTNFSFGLESLVLCVPLDPTSSFDKKLIKTIVKSRAFSQDKSNPDFYVPTKQVKAFGFDVRFVGLAGVALQPGPNLTVAASLEDLTQKAEVETIGHKFQCNDNGCWLRVTNENVVLIYPNPGGNGLTTIQCGYFGE